MKFKSKTEYLLVEEKNRHRFDGTHNPVCKACGFRTYPQWGTHDCPNRKPPNRADVRGAAYWAGHVLSNFDFYRLQPDKQLAALTIAVGYAFGRLCGRGRGMKKFRDSIPVIERLIQKQEGLNPKNIVFDMSERTRGKIRIKKRRPA